MRTTAVHQQIITINKQKISTTSRRFVGFYNVQVFFSILRSLISVQRDNNLTTFRLFKDLFTQREYLSRWFQEQSLVISKIKKFFYLNILTDFESKVDLLIFDKRVRWSFLCDLLLKFSSWTHDEASSKRSLEICFCYCSNKIFFALNRVGHVIKIVFTLELETSRW